jgi:hypothetical protein
MFYVIRTPILKDTCLLICYFLNLVLVTVKMRNRIDGEAPINTF